MANVVKTDFVYRLLNLGKKRKAEVVQVSKQSVEKSENRFKKDYNPSKLEIFY